MQLTVERDEEARVVEVLEDLAAALATDDAAGEAFAGLSYSHQRECAEWIGEARRAETRGRRVTQALERLRAGQTLR